MWGSVISSVMATMLTTGCQAPSRMPLTDHSIYTAVCHAQHADESDPEAWLPDPSCTPGKANPAVTIGQLCPVAHTRQWRPTTSYTNDLKRKQLAQYDYVDSQGGHPQTTTSTEEDHLISLELGGDSTAPENLWPEPGKSPNEKDSVERAAHAAVCRGVMSLPAVQQAIALNWRELGNRLGVKYFSR